MMYRSLVRQALRLALLATLVVLALSACGGKEQQQSKPQPLPEEEGQALRPGEYRSEEFNPSVSFRVGKGWSTTAPEISDALFITRGHETGGLGFVNVQEVYKPTKTGNPNVVGVPEDMVGWFQQHPYLQTSKPEPVAVGGVKGVQFDLVVGDLPADYYGECGSDCVYLLRVGGAYPISLREGEGKARFIILEDVKGETVLMVFVSPASEFDEHAPEAQKVIDTVEWEGS